MKYGVIGNGIVKNNQLLLAYLRSFQQKNTNCNDENLPQIFQLSLKNPKKVDFLLGWGRKKSFTRAKQLGTIFNAPVLTLEDGFLRSLDTGQASRYACSVVIDPIGIYFDGSKPSLLENLICQTVLTDEQKTQALDLIKKITSERLSKYNTTAKNNTLKNLNFDKNTQHILLIDQVANDQSISGAGANEQDFANMLKTACQNHPNAQIWIKAHPAGKIGYLTELDLPNNCQVIRENVNPIELLEVMDEVYTVSSHMGFEALLFQQNGLGKKVHCFGVSWYAGWGLTDDNYLTNVVQSLRYRNAKKRRFEQKQPTILELFYACYIAYSHYANPATGKACDITQAINWLVTNRHWRDNFPKHLTSYHVSFWKKQFVQNYLQTANVNIFVKPRLEPRTLTDKNHFIFPKKNPFLVWGFARKQQLIQKLNNQSAVIYCMEDGFIRSNGLGANLIEPLSVVLDKNGIYYNATQASDLENLLIKINTLNKEQNQRIERLINKLLTQQVSKYNVGKNKKLLINTTKTKILVVGQVEDDMSVKLCASDVKTNFDLLKQVKTDNPNAFIIYKPHPDVQAGLRTGKIDDDKINQFADKVVLDIHIAECLDVVDEVHTISSLTGFEALLRGKKVTCYGLPFYAGFGLTTDKATNPTAQATKQRRQRQTALTLNQLIYASLIDYPLYSIPNGYGLAQVEDVIDFLYPQNGQKTEQKSNRNLFSTLKNELKPIFEYQVKHKLMQTRHIILQSIKRNQ